MHTVIRYAFFIFAGYIELTTTNNNIRVRKMVLLFSNRKSKTEKEIIEILTSFGADYISDKKVSALNGPFTIVSEYKVTDLKLKKVSPFF